MIAMNARHLSLKACLDRSSRTMLTNQRRQHTALPAVVVSPFECAEAHKTRVRQTRLLRRSRLVRTALPPLHASSGGRREPRSPSLVRATVAMCSTKSSHRVRLLPFFISTRQLHNHLTMHTLRRPFEMRLPLLPSSNPSTDRPWLPLLSCLIAREVLLPGVSFANRALLLFIQIPSVSSRCHRLSK